MVFLMSEALKLFKAEYERINKLCIPEDTCPYLTNFLVDPRYEGGESWISLLSCLLLLMTGIELLEELKSRIVQKIPVKKVDTEGLDLCRKMIEQTIISYNKTVDEQLHKLFQIRCPPLDFFGIRKEIVPFKYYHDKKYEDKDGKLVTNPRRIDNLLIDGAENQDDMRRRPFVIADSASGEYVRYFVAEKRNGREYTFLCFMRVPYRKCALCRKDCTQLMHKCGGCRSISYCCKEHQVADRVKHTKEVCRAMRLRREAIKQEEAARDSESKSEIGSDSD